MSLLESAGFSRANPYYIVPQGRVSYWCLFFLTLSCFSKEKYIIDQLVDYGKRRG